MDREKLRHALHNVTHAEGIILAQISVARDTPSLNKRESCRSILERDLWARGYVIGAFRAVVYGTMGNLDDEESYRATVLCFAQFAKRVMGVRSVNEIDSVVNSLMGLSLLNDLQSNEEFINGLETGSLEAFTFVKKMSGRISSNDQTGISLDAPLGLFDHLAQGETPDMPEMEGLSAGRELMLPTLVMAAYSSYISYIQQFSNKNNHGNKNQGQRGGGCVLVLLGAASLAANALLASGCVYVLYL